MKIEPIDLTVRDLVAGYQDDGEGGVVRYGGALGKQLDKLAELINHLSG